MTIVQKLQQRISRIETASYCAHGQMVSSGCEELDQLLPGNGYLRGTITEWFSSDFGNGAAILSLLGARTACRDNGVMVIADPRQQTHPPALAAWGVNLTNVIVLRADSQNDLYWAVNQSLRCKSVAAVWGWFRQIDEQWFRRFQLAAESSGCLGFFMRPERACREPSWSQVRWQVRAKPTIQQERVRQLEVELLRCRGGTAGQKANLAIDPSGRIHRVKRHEKKIPMPLVSAMARTKAHRKASRA